MLTLSQWRGIIEKVPEKAGVYIFKNRSEYIYIGKAKNLKRRLLQHLHSAKKDKKELAIFTHSDRLDYIVVSNEYEALVLERQLINIHKPKYNVVFKYGSGYPMLVITDEPFPRVEIVRDFSLKGQYFGPFFTVNKAKSVKKLIHRLFKLRTCEVLPKPGKLCMDYHLGLCSGPCEGKISREDYLLAVESAKAFLSGEVGNILPKLYRKIEQYSQKLEFEKCALLKEQIESLENLTKGQKVLNLPFAEADLWIYNPATETVQLYLIRAKRLVDRKGFEISQKLHEGLESWLYAYYSVNYIPKLVLYNGGEIKENLLKSFLSDKANKPIEVKREIPEPLRGIVELNNPKVVSDKNKELFEEILRLPFPKRIEGFDISHFAGEGIVGSCVVWENGTMNKSCYRKYRIKTVKGIDDYASLREILSRRAKRIVKGQYPVPDIWLIDGGKGQLNVGIEVKEKFKLPTFVVSLAKKEEILYTEDGREIALKTYPELYRIFGEIRNEAHRFAVGYNRKLRKLKIFGQLPTSERKILERNFENLYELMEAKLEQFEKLGLSPQLKQEIKKYYGDR